MQHDIGQGPVEAQDEYNYRSYDTGVKCFSRHRRKISRVSIRELRPDSIDMDILKGWLDFCNSNHERCSARLEKGQTPSLLLIQCKSRTLTSADTLCDFVALSYVWGTSGRPALDLQCGDLLGELPAVVEDSVKLTLALGYEYLWVDRYCISQNAAKKHDQISRMDEVYRNAQVTIIAAAGMDASHGLPGIGKTPRLAQPKTRVGKHVMISSLPTLEQALKTSKWNTRAWTYQEAILSRRRLVFTEHQVYFECRSMCCCECIDHTASDLFLAWPKSDGGDLILRENESVFRSIGAVGASHDESEIGRTIFEYSQRASSGLTYQSDALNGVVGILRTFATMKPPIAHVCGVPILINPHIARSGTWDPAAGLAMGLGWELTQAAERRDGFPSWSWTGWVGAVQPDNYSRDLPGASSVGTPLIWLEACNGERIPWTDFTPQGHVRFLENTSNLSNAIHLKGSIMKFTLKEDEPHANDPSSSFRAHFCTFNNVHCSAPLRLTREAVNGQELYHRLRDPTRVWEGMLVWRSRSSFRSKIIVFDSVGSGLERVGSIEIEDIGRRISSMPKYGPHTLGVIKREVRRIRLE